MARVLAAFSSMVLLAAIITMIPTSYFAIRVLLTRNFTGTSRNFLTSNPWNALLCAQDITSEGMRYRAKWIKCFTLFLCLLALLISTVIPLQFIQPK